MGNDVVGATSHRFFFYLPRALFLFFSKWLSKAYLARATCRADTLRSAQVVSAPGCGTVVCFNQSSEGMVVCLLKQRWDRQRIDLIRGRHFPRQQGKKQSPFRGLTTLNLSFRFVQLAEQARGASRLSRRCPACFAETQRAPSRPDFLRIKIHLLKQVYGTARQDMNTVSDHDLFLATIRGLFCFVSNPLTLSTPISTFRVLLKAGDGRHYPYLIPMELFWLFNILEGLP